MKDFNAEKMAILTQSVRVYRNLHKGYLSVQRYVPGKGWRVADHVSSVLLADARFAKVRNRVRRTGRKEVRAFVEGQLLAQDAPPLADRPWAPVRYNPHSSDGFAMRADGQIVLVKWADLSWIGSKSGVQITGSFSHEGIDE